MYIIPQPAEQLEVGLVGAAFGRHQDAEVVGHLLDRAFALERGAVEEGAIGLRGDEALGLRSHGCLL